MMLITLDADIFHFALHADAMRCHEDTPTDTTAKIETGATRLTLSDYFIAYMIMPDILTFMLISTRHHDHAR